MSELKESLNNSNIEILENYSKQGYLFHGSPNGEIEILEPRPANDIDRNNEFNNDNAIFATDNLTSSIIFGVVSRDYLPEDIKRFMWATNWATENGVTEVTAKVHESWKFFIENYGKGYVYVLSTETFKEKSGSQRKSKESVKPIDKVDVNLNDFYKAGGKLIFMTEESW
jgi:hypothetical protein